MKVEVQPLKQSHLADLLPRVQPRQAGQRAAMAEANHANLMTAAGPAAAFLVDGTVVSIAGLIDIPTTGRCIVWCVYAGDVLVPFVQLHKRMMAAMRMFPRRRYEAYIDPNWPAAKRLVKVEGFKYEGTMEAFECDGSDRELWALIKRGA